MRIKHVYIINLDSEIRINISLYNIVIQYTKMAINPKFNKPLRLKEPLQEICGGEASLPRYEIVKRVWLTLRPINYKTQKTRE